MTAVRYFDADYIDRIQEFVLLANRLPRGGGQPTEARCSTCRASLGALLNSKGIVFGDFTRQGDELPQLAGSATLEQTVTLTCSRCGRRTKFHFDNKG